MQAITIRLIRGVIPMEHAIDCKLEGFKLPRAFDKVGPSDVPMLIAWSLVCKVSSDTRTVQI